MRVLVTGSSGYIGSRLIPFLLADGHKVTCMDTQWFGEGSMSDNGNLTVNKVDVREVIWGGAQPDWPDAVIHLASISNNDMYALRPLLAETVNQVIPQGRVIYASSVAAYGTSDDLLTEDSPLKPTTPYGRDKAYVEEIVLKAGGTAVRSASVCGHSPNMRFDTPVNRMTRDALTKGVITVNGGKQSRCHIHLDDLCAFYCLLLKAPQFKIRGQAFNVVRENQTISHTAEWTVQKTLDAGIEIKPSSDERSYKVSNRKAIEVLNFAPSRTIENAVRDMQARFKARNPQYQDFSPARMRML